MWLGLGRESSRRSSYPGTHRAAEAEIRANSPSCSDCSRIKLPQFLTRCLRNMSKTVRIGIDSRWVGWVGLVNGHCAASWVSILGKQSVGVQVAETTGDVNSGGFLKPVFGVGFGMQVLNANIWILFLSCQDPEEDRAVGAKDDKQVVFADLAAVVRKFSRGGGNITGLVHCGQLTSALRVTN